MNKSTLQHYAKRASVPTASVLLALLTFAAPTTPVSATTALGRWWTNHSTCRNSNGLVTVDTQGRYYNVQSTNGPRYAQFIGAAVSSGYSGVKLTKFNWQLMAVGSNGVHYQYDGYNLNLGSGFPVPTGEFIPGKQSTLIGHNLKPYVKYQSWLSNGAYCQGQWNIGQ